MSISIHILEATIAVLIVAGVMVTVYDDQSAREVLSVEDYSYSLQNEILEDIAENRTLRLDAMKVVVDLPTDPHYDVLNAYVATKVPDDFGYLLRVCNLGDTNDYCKMPPVIFYETLESDVFVEETVVSAEVGDGGGEEEYSPKKLKLFFWEGGFPEGYCRDECEEDRVPLSCSDDFTEVAKRECGDFDTDDSCLEYGAGTETVEVCGEGKICVEGACTDSLFRKLVCPKRDYVFCDYCSKYSPCGGYVGGWDSGDCGSKDEWTCYNFFEGEEWESECLPLTQALPSCPAELSGCTPSSKYPAMRFYEPADSSAEPCICVDTIWTPTDTSQVCSTEFVHQTSNCGTERDVDGTKTTGECATTCSDGTAVGSCSVTKPFSCSSALQLVPSCSTCGCPSGMSCNSGTNSCYTPVASLSASITRTTTEAVDDGGCFANRCYYQISVSNSGEASGVVWKRVVSDGFEQVYNQVVNSGATVDLGQGWSKSDCYVSYSYSVNIYDTGGNNIGGTSFTCPHP